MNLHAQEFREDARIIRVNDETSILAIPYIVYDRHIRKQIEDVHYEPINPWTLSH